MKALEI